MKLFKKWFKKSTHKPENKFRKMSKKELQEIIRKYKKECSLTSTGVTILFELEQEVLCQTH